MRQKTPHPLQPATSAPLSPAAVTPEARALNIDDAVEVLRAKRAPLARLCEEYPSEQSRAALAAADAQIAEYLARKRA